MKFGGAPRGASVVSSTRRDCRVRKSRAPPRPSRDHSSGRMSPDLDFEHCYAAAVSRDERFDGLFIVGVHSTGIYCRPSCPAPVRPKRRNVAFYRSTAAAQLAGLRACKRCRPDAAPGSPEWDARGDLAGRAMRLIAEGIVDREGVGAVARRLAVSERQLQRVLVEEVGAPALAIARSQRAQTARILVETTELPFIDVAFSAGFRSVRQFNDTFRQMTGAGGRCASCALGSRTDGSCPGPVRAGRPRCRSCSRCPASGRGPPTTSRCCARRSRCVAGRRARARARSRLARGGCILSGA